MRGTDDPTLAQFVSADSVVPDWFDPQSLNRYAYVQNDPVNNWDPSGHMPVSWRVQQKKEVEARGGRHLNPNAATCANRWVTCVSAYDGDVPRFVSAWWIGSKGDRWTGTYTVREYIATRGFRDQTWQRTIVFVRSVTVSVESTPTTSVKSVESSTPATKTKREGRRRSTAAPVGPNDCVSCKSEEESSPVGLKGSSREGKGEGGAREMSGDVTTGHDIRSASGDPYGITNFTQSLPFKVYESVKFGAAYVIAQTGATIGEIPLGYVRALDLALDGALLGKSRLRTVTLWEAVHTPFEGLFRHVWGH